MIVIWFLTFFFYIINLETLDEAIHCLTTKRITHTNSKYYSESEPIGKKRKHQSDKKKGLNTKAELKANNNLIRRKKEIDNSDSINFNEINKELGKKEVQSTNTPSDDTSDSDDSSSSVSIYFDCYIGFKII